MIYRGRRDLGNGVSETPGTRKGDTVVNESADRLAYVVRKRG